MENRVVALAVLENLIHWPLPNRSGYVAPSSSTDNGGEEDNYGGGAVTAGDADDLAREPRQRKQDRYRAVLLLPHLCHKLGTRWVESEVVPYLLRCLEEDDAQLSLVGGLALLGVTLPRRTPLGPASAASPTAPPGNSSSSSSTNAAPTSSTKTYNAYLSLDDVQPVCTLLAASGTEETRQFAAQVVLPHLYFGTSLERDITLESWDVKYVPLSVLHADMTTTTGGGEVGDRLGGASNAEEEEGDMSALASFVGAVRQQLIRQRQQQLAKNRQASASAADTAAAADAGSSPASSAVAGSRPNPRIKVKSASDAAAMVLPLLTDDDVRQRCRAIACEDEQLQFLFSGVYDTLTGPWGFSSRRLASLTHGSTPLLLSSQHRRGSGTAAAGGAQHSKSGGGGATAVSTGGGFRSFRGHGRRVDNEPLLRGIPQHAQRPLYGADLELYGAAYATDKSSSADGACDDFFSVNVRARALVGDITRWMEALGGVPPAETSPTSTAPPPPPLLLPGSTTLCLYDYLSHEPRREVLRSRWRGQLKLLQSLFESSFPGPVAVAVELISGQLHAIQMVLSEIEAHFQRARSSSRSSSGGNPPVVSDAVVLPYEMQSRLLWDISAPSSPLLSTAQLQSFVYRTTRRHVAYCVAAAVSLRKVPVPPTLAESAASVAWRAPTDALARLLRGALLTAQSTLTDLLVRHHIFAKLEPSFAALSPTPSNSEVKGDDGREGGSSGGGGCALLQFGAGPTEARAFTLSAWDVSFTPAAANTTGATAILPDDASFLLTAGPPASTAAVKSSPAAKPAGGSVTDQSRWLPGTLNAVSLFRVHRLIRRAVLRAVPLCVDFLSLCSNAPPPPASTESSPTSPTPVTPAAASVTATASPPTASIFSLSAVCPLLLQVLVPPGSITPLLAVLQAAVQLLQSPASPSQPRRHADPTAAASQLSTTAPDLWAAMTARGSVIGTAESSASAVMGEECPASLDFGLLEAALDAVQRLTAEAAAHLASVGLPSSTAGAAAATSAEARARMVDSICAQLFTVLTACVRWVPRYTNWKARWLIAQRLPRLQSTFCFLLATVASMNGPGDDVRVGPASSSQRAAGSQQQQQQQAVSWLEHTLHLSTSVWSCAEAFGVAPLNDLTDDEEVEVRCIAVRSAASVFRRIVEAVLRISAAARATASSHSSAMLLPTLAEPLAQLLDATAQCVLVAANDVDARVRCRSAEALAVLSRTLSVLVAADGWSAKPSAGDNAVSTRGDSVWSRYLRSNTDALLRLMSDEKPTVQLALVSQLTDLLLLRMRHPFSGSKSRSSSTSGAGVASRLSDEEREREERQQRSADQVQHEALLQCLRKLAQHELWRLREQYAVLLAHLCGRLLQTALIQPRKAQSNAVVAAPSPSNSSPPNPASPMSDSLTVPDNSPYGHTHPLYQLARTDLLTLLVAVLFDKVKAVRDTALDAVERMCVQLAAASRHSNNSLNREAGGGPLSAAAGAGVRSSSGGSAGRGRSFESAISGGEGGGSLLQHQSGTGTGTYNANTFVDDVLWPRITAYAPAWETYLSRSALLHIAMRLRVDKASVFIPLLDQLARDPVLNVRLVVAKIILEVLLRSSPDVYAMSSAYAQPSKDGEDEGGADGAATSSASYKPELPSGTVAYSILMNKPPHPLLAGGYGGSGGAAAAASDLPPLQFNEEERTGVVLQILRQLLKDASSDVRDEAAKALKVCF